MKVGNRVKKVKNGVGAFLWRLSIIILSALLPVATTAFCGQVALEWAPSLAADVAGYKIYYGTSPGGYTASINVGNTTSYTISGLQEDTNYYFATASYDSLGQETLFREITARPESGQASCAVALSQDTILAGAVGGSGEIQVLTGSQCAWKAAADGVPWLSVKNEGPGTAHYVIAPNAGMATRTAGVTIGGKILTVIQAGSQAMASATYRER